MNIYNKTVLVPNGTLLGNWYEEECLRKKTGEGRTIPGKHVKKKCLDFDNAINNPNPRDDTFKRIGGEKPDQAYWTFNQTYGDFSQPENRWKKLGVKEKIFNDFFKCYVTNDKSALERTMKSSIDQALPQNHQSEDNIQIGDKYHSTKECATNPYGSTNAFQETQAKDCIDKYIPYYNNKEMPFWSTTLEKGSKYRSITQELGATSRPANFKHDKAPTSPKKIFQNVYLNDYDVDYYNKYKRTEHCNLSNDQFNIIIGKILNTCEKKGWIGFRKLKLFLKNMAKRATDVVNREEFKYFCTNFGIFLTDQEIELIFGKFEEKKSQEINFIQFLDSFRIFNQPRQKLIEEFLDKVKCIENDSICLSTLFSLLKPELHPEVINHLKTIQEIRFEYQTSWESLKDKKECASPENFISFFADISTCIEDDVEYLQVLRSLGYSG